jgi:hypothetical protein
VLGQSRRPATEKTITLDDAAASGLPDNGPEFFDEVCALVAERNTPHWLKGGLGGEPGIGAPLLQFELNGLWFDTAFQVWRH